ncbi:hypothetical protein C0389_03805 [bacterium]|nr:hypothetical protein [bacterium]
MICPKCECEYLDNVKTCVDCGTELISIEQFEGNLIHPKDWVVIYVTSDLIEAEMFKANLNGAEIESIIISKLDRNYLSFGGVSPVKLMVKKKDADEARSIINDINSTKLDDEE